MISALGSRIQDFIFKPQADEPAPILLHRRRIYILPTGHGLVYAFMLLVLFIGSINYTLSLGYVLTFFLAALGNVAMLHTFRNLRGLVIRWRTPEPVFAGDTAVFPLLLENPSRSGRFAIDAWIDEDDHHLLEVPADSALVRIPLRTDRRGPLRLGRVVIETRYPLGLFCAWSRVTPGTHCIVYPRPAPADLPLPLPAENNGTGVTNIAGDEEFQFLRNYRTGDSPRRISWRAYARERGLLTKQFAAEAGGEIFLNLDTAPGRDVEDKLSRLVRWVLDAEARSIPYGLRLDGDEIPPSLGNVHLSRCLEKLALYGLHSPGN